MLSLVREVLGPHFLDLPEFGVSWQRGTKGNSLDTLKPGNSTMTLTNQNLGGGKSSILWVSAKECRHSLSGDKNMRWDGEIF